MNENSVEGEKKKQELNDGQKEDGVSSTMYSSKDDVTSDDFQW